jgi:hypothetical protein
MTLCASETMLTNNGYRVGFASDILKNTMQPRLADYLGLYAIDDPNDNADGFCLRGDNRNELVIEAMAHFEGFLV